MATVRLNIVLPADLEAAFRAAIFRTKGMKKGNISEAFAEAVRLWIQAAPTARPRARPAKLKLDAQRLEMATREGRAFRERREKAMTPAERMELAARLSRYAREMS